MLRGYKVRIYPTKEQERKIKNHIGACRFVWNYMIDIEKQRRDNGDPFLSAYGMGRLITSMKNEEEYKWSNEVSRASITMACMDLQKAYSMFFSHKAEYPRYKSKKRSSDSYGIRAYNMWFSNQFVMIEKVGRIKYKTDLVIPLGRKCGVFHNSRISIIGGKIFLSFCLECESQTLELTDKTMGIDLGVKELAVVACGDKHLAFHNINKSKRIRALQNDIKRIQRSISRKYEASKARTGRYEKTKNIEREEEKLRGKYNRINGIRHNYLHQTTHQLVSMLPAKVVMEDLNILGLMKNKHLSKSIAEQRLCEFIRQMEYKCEWNGIQFIQAPRLFPSSKTCSCCGSIKRDLKLSDRTYVCQACGLEIDRDLNAAINLMRYADLHT